jgi:hypothetical protein
VLINDSKCKLKKTLSLLSDSMLLEHIFVWIRSLIYTGIASILCNCIGFKFFANSTWLIKYHGLMSFVVLY